jgi:hypothetical protein
MMVYSAHAQRRPGMNGIEHEESVGSARINAVFTTCAWCDRDIYVGNAQVTIAHNIEQVTWDGDMEQEVIETIYSDILVTLCAACGNRLGSWVEAMRGQLSSSDEPEWVGAPR